MIFCHGRYSGMEADWLLFSDETGTEWEEKANEWEEVIHLCHGLTRYRNKYDKREAMPID